MAAYIKFDGVDGESIQHGHDKWSDLLSFSFGTHKPCVGTGVSRRTGDLQVGEMQISKLFDVGNPKCFKAICKGTCIPKVEIHCTANSTDGTEVTYLTYELKNAYICDQSVSGGSHDRPTETMVLNFEEIKVKWDGVTVDGKDGMKSEFAWNVPKGEEC